MTNIRVLRPSADTTRSEILTAALDLFSELSFGGASTRQIAQRAGVPQPLLAYHFGSKDALWRGAVGSLFERLVHELSESARHRDSSNPIEAAQASIRDFVHFSAKNPQLHRIITQTCKSEGEHLEWLVNNYIRPLFNRALSIFRPLIAQGVVRNIPEAHLYYIFTGAAATMFVLAPECRLLTGVDPLAKDQVELHANFVIDTLFIKEDA